MSKWVIVILAFLIVIIGALGAFSFNLNKELIALTELQKETSLQIMSLQSSINTLGEEIASQARQTKIQIEQTASQIEQARSQITRAESRINALTSEVAASPYFLRPNRRGYLNRQIV